MIARSVSPLVILAMLRALCEVDGGVESGIAKVSPPCGMDRGTDEVGLPQLREGRAGSAGKREQSGSTGTREQTGPRKVGLHDRGEIIRIVQQQHELAKAVKADDAEVPVHISDAVVFKHQPSEEERQALNIIRDGVMGFYRRRPWGECRECMRKKFGPGWLSKARITRAPSVGVYIVRDI